jgi:hypothetical protein
MELYALAEWGRRQQKRRYVQTEVQTRMKVKK